MTGLFLLLLINSSFQFVGDWEYFIKSCDNQSFELIESGTPRWPLIASPQNYEGVHGTVEFKAIANQNGRVIDLETIDAGSRRFVKETRRSIKSSWVFDKSEHEKRCFYITVVYFKRLLEID